MAMAIPIILEADDPDGFYLDDFGTGSFDLTPEHKRRLGDLARQLNAMIRFSRHERFQITLVGSASQIGSDDFNMKLSRQRAEEVRKFLADRIRRWPVIFKLIAKGEEGPADAALMNNARDRSVGVSVRVVGIVPPSLPPVDPGEYFKPRAPQRKTFDLQVIALNAQVFKLGLKWGRIVMNFTVSDDKTREDYTFVGRGGGVGFGVMIIGGARSIRRGAVQTMTGGPLTSPGDFVGEGQLDPVTMAFTVGDTGLTRHFQFPPCIPRPPKFALFIGDVTKGFDPLIPEIPDAG